MVRRMDLDSYVVSVTQAHITKAAPIGMPRSLCCPVAVALTEGTSCLWAVGRRDAWRRDGDRADGARNVLGLPLWMVDIIGDYDIWGDMEPFRFTLCWFGTRWQVDVYEANHAGPPGFRTILEAADWLLTQSGVAGDYHDTATLTRAFRAAAVRLHPDTGGDHESFLLLQAAVEMFRT